MYSCRPGRTADRQLVSGSGLVGQWAIVQSACYGQLGACRESIYADEAADGGQRAVLAKVDDDRGAETSAHHTVDEAKRALGERGPVWWKDGSPDLNRHMAKTRLMPNGTRRSGGRTTEGRMTAAATFDVDRTLVNSVDLHALAWHEAFINSATT
jgi:hypothetical protein